MDEIANTVIFISTKFQEIYPPDIEVQARTSNITPERMIELEAEILCVLDYRVQPTIELSVMGIIKAELDIKNSAVFEKMDAIIINGVSTGLLRETNIISTLFGLVYIQACKLSSSLSSKFERICKKYEIDTKRAKIDANTFLNLLSAYRNSFKECSDLLSN